MVEKMMKKNADHVFIGKALIDLQAERFKKRCVLQILACGACTAEQWLMLRQTAS